MENKMVNIVLSDELKDVLKTEVQRCNKEINIVTGFCKKSTLEFLNSFAIDGIKKRLLVRFLPSDISSGATDKEIYDYAKQNGWQLFIDPTIHAKTYIFDHIKCVLGSANTTNRGVGLAQNSNTEASAYFSITEEQYEKIITLYRNAILLTDEIYDRIINACDDEKVIQHVKKIKIIDEINCLMSEDFPTMETDKIELYSLRSYKWLVSTLHESVNKEMYFGELSQSLHSVFIKDPRPYRKDIKAYLKELLNCIERNSVEKIIIDRPNYSQRIRILE